MHSGRTWDGPSTQRIRKAFADAKRALVPKKATVSVPVRNQPHAKIAITVEAEAYRDDAGNTVVFLRVPKQEGVFLLGPAGAIPVETGEEARRAYEILTFEQRHPVLRRVDAIKVSPTASRVLAILPPRTRVVSADGALRAISS